MSGGVSVRRARPDDVDPVVAFTRNTWAEADRAGGDYLPDVFADWVGSDDDRRRTLVAELDGEVAGVVRAVRLSEHEAWLQGMRVAPAARGAGVGTALTRAAFEWAREAGATVARNMVFSWNEMGLGLSRAAGFDPVTEFRWAHPEPDADAESGATVTDEVNAAWGFWGRSDAASDLCGLVLDMDETWAVRELDRDLLTRAADETALLVLQDGSEGTRGFAYRSRTFEREGDDGSERWAEYGVGAWADAASCRALLSAVARDAAAADADGTRVLIPETARTVSDAAACRVSLADDPDFVFGADLTRY